MDACGPGSRPQPGIDGRVPAGSGVSGLWCNLSLVSHQGTSGAFKVLRYGFSHGMTLSDDGNRAYIADPTAGQMTILDTSQIQARKPNPQVREVSLDFFCLRPNGIRVAYPSAAVLRHLSGLAQRRVRGRVVLALTANPDYALLGVRPGDALGPVAGRLRTGSGFQIGKNRSRGRSYREGQPNL